MKKLIFWLRETVAYFFELVQGVVNVVLLGFVYFFGVGLTFFVARLFGKRFLLTKKQESYWRDFDSTEKVKKNIYRQF